MKRVTLNLNELQRYFGMWLKSNPFDIGITTQNALFVIKLKKLDPLESYENTILGTSKSLSNGCLMRATPLAVWGHKLNKEELYQSVKLQTMFTHSHETAVITTYLYCYAIGLLINSTEEAV